MAIVYDKKTGRPVKCGEADAKILIKSGHYIDKKSEDKKPTRKIKGGE